MGDTSLGFQGVWAKDVGECRWVHRQHVGTMSVRCRWASPEFAKSGLRRICLYVRLYSSSCTNCAPDCFEPKRPRCVCFVFCFGGVRVPRLFRTLRRQCLWNNDKAYPLSTRLYSLCPEKRPSDEIKRVNLRSITKGGPQIANYVRYLRTTYKSTYN